MSYGLDNFESRVLPAIFCLAIGPDSDAIFIHELAKKLNMPESYFDT